MSKQTDYRSPRNRRKKRNPVTVVAVGFVALLAIWIGITAFSNSGASAPDVTQSRLRQDPTLGSADAPVKIIEYAAYSCSSCRSLHESGVIERIVEEFDGQVAFVYRDFPVIVPSYDRIAAEAAQCALDQSQDGFWAFHDRLYTTDYMAHDTPEEFGGLAAEVGLDGEALTACVESDTHRRTVAFDQTRAERLGLRGTPSLFINDEPLFAVSYEGMRSAVLAALDG